MIKLPPKFVMAILRKNGINLDKTVFERLVKDLAKESNPSAKLEQYINDRKK